MQDWLNDVHNFIVNALNIQGIEIPDGLRTTPIVFQDAKLNRMIGEIAILNNLPDLGDFLNKIDVNPLKIKALIKAGKITGRFSFEIFYRMIGEKLDWYSPESIINHPEIRDLRLSNYQTWVLITGYHSIVNAFQRYSKSRTSLEGIWMKILAK